jgi:hypothetical protein
MPKPTHIIRGVVCLRPRRCGSLHVMDGLSEQNYFCVMFDIVLETILLVRFVTLVS